MMFEFPAVDHCIEKSSCKNSSGPDLVVHIIACTKVLIKLPSGPEQLCVMSGLLVFMWI